MTPGLRVFAALVLGLVNQGSPSDWRPPMARNYRSCSTPWWPLLAANSGERRPCPGCGESVTIGWPHEDWRHGVPTSPVARVTLRFNDDRV